MGNLPQWDLNKYSGSKDPEYLFIALNGELSGFDADALRLGLFRLGQLNGQDAVLKFRLGFVGHNIGLLG